MKPVLLILATLFSINTFGQNCARRDDYVTTATGQAVAGASVTYYLQAGIGQAPSGTPAAMFSDAQCSVPYTPLTNGYGHVAVYAAPGYYTVVYASALIQTQTLADQSIASTSTSAASNPVNSVQISDGAGGFNSVSDVTINPSTHTFAAQAITAKSYDQRYQTRQFRLDNPSSTTYGIQEAIAAAAPSGAEIDLECGVLTTTTPVSITRGNLVFKGCSPYGVGVSAQPAGTAIVNTTGDIFQFVGGIANVQMTQFKAEASAGHVLNFDLATSGVESIYVHETTLVQTSTGFSVIHYTLGQGSGCFFGPNSFYHNEIANRTSFTVPIINIECDSPNGTSFVENRIYASNTATAYAVHFAHNGNNPFPQTDAFIGNVVEQPGGGGFDIQSIRGLVVERNAEWDLSGAPSHPFISLTKNTTGRIGQTVRVLSNFATFSSSAAVPDLYIDHNGTADAIVEGNKFNYVGCGNSAAAFLPLVLNDNDLGNNITAQGAANGCLFVGMNPQDKSIQALTFNSDHLWTMFPTYGTGLFSLLMDNTFAFGCDSTLACAFGTSVANPVVGLYPSQAAFFQKGIQIPNQSVLSLGTTLANPTAAAGRNGFYVSTSSAYKFTSTTDTNGSVDSQFSRGGSHIICVDGSNAVGDCGGFLHSSTITTTGGFVVAALTTPVNGTFTTASTGGTLAGSASYYYRVDAYNANGSTLASTETSIAVPAGTNTNTVTVTWASVPGAAGYHIYGRTTGAELRIGTVTGGGATLSFVDDGSVTPSGALPSSNTTLGSITGAATVSAGTLTLTSSGTTVTTAGTAVTNGTCQAQTGATIAGVTTASVVAWSIPTALPATWQTGITVVPVVTANTVTLNLCNPTAGSITPAAQAVNIRVIQ